MVKKNAEARSAIEGYRTLLVRFLATGSDLDWETLYDRREYGECTLPSQPTYEAVASRLGVRKKNRFVELFWKSRVAKREAQERAAQQELEQETARWESACAEARSAHDAKKAKWLKKQKRCNAGVDEMRSGLAQGHPPAVEFYFEKLFAARQLLGLDKCAPVFSMEEQTGILART